LRNVFLIFDTSKNFFHLFCAHYFTIGLTPSALGFLLNMLVMFR